MTTTKKVERKTIERGQLLIGGQWRDGVSGETMAVTDPTTEATITEVQKASAEDATAAIDAAYEAFETGPWGRMGHEDRAKILFRMADLMDERAEDFAIREAMDMGMPYSDWSLAITTEYERRHGCLCPETAVPINACRRGRFHLQGMQRHDTTKCNSALFWRWKDGYERRVLREDRQDHGRPC